MGGIGIGAVFEFVAAALNFGVRLLIVLLQIERFIDGRVGGGRCMRACTEERGEIEAIITLTSRVNKNILNVFSCNQTASVV